MVHPPYVTHGKWVCYGTSLQNEQERGLTDLGPIPLEILGMWVIANVLGSTQRWYAHQINASGVHCSLSDGDGCLMHQKAGYISCPFCRDHGRCLVVA